MNPTSLRPRSLVNLVVTLALFLAAGVLPATARNQSVVPAASDRSHVAEALHGAPVLFVENTGQFADGVCFQVRSGDRTVWLASDALWITVLAARDPSPTRDADRAGFPTPLTAATPSPQKGVNIKLSFDGANPHTRLQPFDRLSTQVSYFRGDDASAWHPDVPVWGGVRYVNLYPGIDLEIIGENGHLVQRMIVQPGADLGIVRLQVDGADNLTLREDALHLTTSAGAFDLPLLRIAGATDSTLARPAIAGYQVARPFSTAIARPQSPTVDRQLGASDLLYSTLMGGWSEEDGLAIAVDGSGAAYVAGSTLSYDFPTTPGAFATTYGQGGFDAFVAKLDPTGSDLVYATFLGGDKDECNSGGFPFVYCSIAVDGNGNAYIAGLTSSADFPTTLGALQQTAGGGKDMFVTELNASGSALVYSTYLGGTRDEYGYDVAIDADGNAYVTGASGSLDFPTTAGAYDTTTIGGDAFIAKLSPAGSTLVYSTLVGGDDDLDSGRAIATDESGNAYVTGVTCSDDFPTTPGALDRTLTWTDCDSFVTKLNSAGAALVYSTFLGGSEYDYGNAIVVDASGAAHVAGHTESTDFSTTVGAYNTMYNGGNADGFVAKLSPTGSNLLYATYLGGISYDQPSAIAVDGSGAAYVAGWTVSYDFPTTPRAFDASLGGWDDGFVTKLDPEGSALVYSTFLGGSSGLSGSAYDHAAGLVIDKSDYVYVTGATECDDFPTTLGAFDTTHDSNSDVFVTKLAPPSSRVDAYVEAPALAAAPPGGFSIIPVQYGNNGAMTATLTTLTAALSGGLTYVSDTSGVPTIVGGTTVTWNLMDMAYRDRAQFSLRLSVAGNAHIGARFPLTLTIGSAGTEDDTSDNSAMLAVSVVRHIYLPLLLGGD